MTYLYITEIYSKKWIFPFMCVNRQREMGKRMRLTKTENMRHSWSDKNFIFTKASDCSEFSFFHNSSIILLCCFRQSYFYFNNLSLVPLPHQLPVSRSEVFTALFRHWELCTTCGVKLHSRSCAWTVATKGQRSTNAFGAWTKVG